MFFIVNFNQYRLRGPVIAIENPATQKIYKPRPICVLVVIGGYMEAYPAASVFHVFFKSIAFGFCIGIAIEHNHYAIFFQLFVTILRQIHGNIQYKTVTVIQFFEELYCLQGELIVCLFCMLSIVNQCLEAGTIGIISRIPLGSLSIYRKCTDSKQ